MTDTWQLRQRRHNLMAVSPYCDECGREVFEYNLQPGQKVPPNQATIQHVNSRIKYPDGRPRRGMRILMCYECNQADAVEERRELKLEKERQELIERVLGHAPEPKGKRK